MIISYVSSQLFCLLTRSIQFFAETYDARGFVFLSPKQRNITTRMSLLSYQYQKRLDYMTSFVCLFSLMQAKIEEVHPIYLLTFYLFGIF